MMFVRTGGDAQKLLTVVMIHPLGNVNKTSRQYAKKLFRHFSLDEDGGPTS